MNRKDTEMINNNLDFDKYSNHTITTTTTTTATLNTQLPSTPPSPPLSLTTTTATTTNSNTQSSRTKQQQQQTTTSSTSSSSSSSSSSTSTRFANAMPSSAASAASAVTAAASNYFQRFDNRIAANLAAVLNGSRFRSSSVGGGAGGRSSPAKSLSRQANAANAANANLVATAVGSNVNVAMPQTPQTLRKSRLDHGEDVLHMQLNNYAPQGQGAKGGGFFGDVDGNDCGGSASGSETGSMGRQRPQQLFAHGNLNCNDNEKLPRSSQTSSQTTPPSSDEDNSPTELNNCKRLADKPPLVKRLTMGLLRGHEESRPLVQGGNQSAAAPDSLLGGMAGSCTTSTSSSSSAPSAPCLDGELDLDEVYGKRSLAHMFPGVRGGDGDGLDAGGGSNQLYSNGYINEEAFEPEKYIASKFGDSCRQSLTAIPMLDTLNLNDNSEFNLKKRYLRETSSANSSPKIFANRLRLNASSSRYTNGGGGGTTCSNSSGYGSHGNRLLMPTDDDDDELELKEASWFQAGISRDIAVEVLASKSPGAFLVRKSSSKPGCYALTLRVPSPPGPKIANYIILRTARGYKIKGFRKEFTSLKALITHHSVMPELLPVPLAMPRPTNMTSSRRNLDDFDTYDSLQMLLKYLRAKNMENE